MTKEDVYLAPTPSAVMDAIYRAISRYKTNRMWTPNGQEIASYVELLCPDLGTVNGSEITLFVKSSEAAKLIERAPLPNLTASLDQAMISTGNYPVLSGVLGVLRMIDY